MFGRGQNASGPGWLHDYAVVKPVEADFGVDYRRGDSLHRLAAGVHVTDKAFLVGTINDADSWHGALVLLRD